MGLFDKFFKSFDDEVNEAIDKVNGMGLGVRNLGAKIEGKTVTLTGDAPSREASVQVMEAFNGMVETDNTLNTIRVEAPPAPEPAPAPEPEPAEVRIHEVVAGDTLGALAQKYYGAASKYMKIFEANRDILDNPDLIKVGQKLKIPE
jgi:nucleoid-associated protein YgaU